MEGVELQVDKALMAGTSQLAVETEVVAAALTCLFRSNYIQQSVSRSECNARAQQLRTDISDQVVCKISSAVNDRVRMQVGCTIILACNYSRNTLFPVRNVAAELYAL